MKKNKLNEDVRQKILKNPDLVLLDKEIFMSLINEKNFSDDDYLLLVGDPSIIGACCAIASRYNNGRYKVLKWDRLERRYFPIEFNILI